MLPRIVEKDLKKVLYTSKLFHFKMVEVALFSYLMERYLADESQPLLSNATAEIVNDFVSDAIMKMRTPLSRLIGKVEQAIQQEDETIHASLDDLQQTLDDSKEIYHQYKKILKMLKVEDFMKIKDSQGYKEDSKLQALLSTYLWYKQLRKTYLFKFEKNQLASLTQLVSLCQTLQAALSQQADLQDRVNLIISPAARLRELINIESYRVRGRGMTRELNTESNANQSTKEENKLSLARRLSDLTSQHDSLLPDGKELDFTSVIDGLKKLEIALQALITTLSQQKLSLTLFTDYSKLDAILKTLLDNQHGLLPALVNPMGKINLVLGIENIKEWVNKNKEFISQTKISPQGQGH